MPASSHPRRLGSHWRHRSLHPYRLVCNYSAPMRVSKDSAATGRERAPTKRQPDRTRQKLLASAFEEIHRNGFRAASLDAILENSSVTKGALYHHFGSKAELGYAVVDEVVRPFVEARWRPAVESDDPVAAGVAVVRDMLITRADMASTFGCPFSNLCQEMSPVDEGFRKRLNSILDDWRNATIAGLRRGQQKGTVRKDVDPKAAAAFIIAGVEGCIGMAKASRSKEFLQSGMRGLIDYLEHLRPSCTTH